MRMHPFQRTEMLVGQEGFARLQGASVCVIGLGGVGSHVAEGMVRSGIGHITLVDFDRVCVTNLNRQLHATRSTVNELKAELMGERCRAINPKAEIRVMPTFFDAHTTDTILDRPFDMVFDCIDNMTAKVNLLVACKAKDQPVICCMGAGGRMDPTRIRVTDIAGTKNDPFARIARDLLRQRGIHDGITCVWTSEPPNELDAVVQSHFHCICPGKDENEKHGCETRLQVQGSVSWMPAIFGFTMVGAAVNQMLGRPIHDGRGEKFVRTKPVPNKMSRAKRKTLVAAAVAESK